MRRLLSVLLPAFVLIAAANVGVAQTPDVQPAAPDSASPSQPKKQQRPSPKAEWLDSNRGEPNGTKYRTFTSKVLDGREVSYLVYLPPGYAEQTRRYPVIYWLHGMNGNQRAGASVFVPLVDAAIKQGKLPPAIVILVNGMVTAFYCDTVDGQRPVESVIIKDLIPHVDQTYRTIARREGRLIEGYSMGGYGAGHLGFKYPELFGAVVVNAGALMDPDVEHVPKDGPMYGVFGDDRQRRMDEHPEHLARKNADKLRGQTHIRIGCGKADSLLPRNQSLDKLLTQLKIEHEYEEVSGVAHSSAVYYKKLGGMALEFHRKFFVGLDAAGDATP
jgi:enterochelin esterase-like enzyme